jgi:SAM-dependent methyltransferase
MNESQKIRETVSAAYAKAVSAPSEGCGCCSGPDPKGSAVKQAGYTRKDLESLPGEAVINSFGCGNPVAFSGVKEGDVVVDLGSGAGIDLLIAAKKVGPLGRVIGVDMTDEMIAKARENISAAGLSNTEIRKGIIEDLPVESGTVDWVISNCVISLSPEKPRVFAEIARVLKSGGRMLVSDMVVEDFPEWARRDEALYSSCVAGAISEAQYTEGLREAGLEGVEAQELFVVDGEQLVDFLRSELADGDSNIAEWAASNMDKTVNRTAQLLTGKLRSVQFSARKAGG